MSTSTEQNLHHVAPVVAASTAPQSGPRSLVVAGRAARFHALDALRATMMLLGLVFHTTCTYVTFPMGIAWFFQDRATARLVDVVFTGIHVFRMPVFMVLGGFFGALLLERRGTATFVKNRATRIGLPLLVGYLLLMPLSRFFAGFAHGRQDGLASPLSHGLEYVLAAPYSDNLLHLWFLWHLLLLYALALGVRRFVSGSVRDGVATAFHRAVSFGRGLAFLPFAVATSVLATFMQFGILEASIHFIPNPLVLGVYVCFFSFGWLLCGERDALPRMKKGLVPKGAAAFLLWGVHLASLIHNSKVGEVGVTPMVVVSATSGMLSAWLSVSFCIGVSLRFFSSESPLLRYLTDASYWIYLVHVPLAFLMAGVITPLEWSALPKAGFVLVTVSALSLAGYALLVRRTWVGQWLNGRKYT